MLALVARALAQPEHEREHGDQHHHDDAADEDVVGSVLHQPLAPPCAASAASAASARAPASSTASSAARPRGPRKYSCIHGWSKANNSGIVPTATTLRSASTATRSQIV